MRVEAEPENSICRGIVRTDAEAEKQHLPEGCPEVYSDTDVAEYTSRHWGIVRADAEL